MNVKYPIEFVHTLSVDEVIKALETNAQHGIGSAEAATRTSRYGANVYTAQKQKSIWLMFLLQFKSPIVYLLLFAVAVTLYFQNYIESIAIGVVIFANALIGFFMELQARSSMHEVTKNKFIWFAIIVCAGLIVMVFAVPQMRRVLGLTTLSANVWLISIIASLIPLLLVQLYKIMFGRKAQL